MYTNLLQKMFNITNKAKNKIEVPEKYIITIFNNTINAYMKDLEEKIIAMKKAYIETLVKKHFKKDKNKKKEIILKAKIPKRRNEVKKVFNQLMVLIKTKLEPKHQKYCYLLILKILEKYKIISGEEIAKIKILFKEMIDERKNNKKAIHNKQKKKVKYNYDDKKWIDQNKSRIGFTFKAFSIIIPLAYIINYAYANFKV